MMEWYTVQKGRGQMNVRARGLQQLLDQGWELVGAEKPEEPKTPQATPVDSGPIRAKSPRKTK